MQTRTHTITDGPLMVAAASDPAKVAGSLTGHIRANGKAELQAIGAGAINQAVKAICIARGYMAPAGIDLLTVPAFVDLVVNGAERTGIRFLVKPTH